MPKIMIVFSVLLMAAVGPVLAETPKEGSPAPRAKTASGCPHAAQAARKNCPKAAKAGCNKARAKNAASCCRKAGKAARDGKNCPKAAQAANGTCCKGAKAAAKKGCCKKAAGAKCPHNAANNVKSGDPQTAPEVQSNPAAN